MDNETARANMIEQQIRPWNVLAMQTLTVLGTIRREDFVPTAYQQQAFMDVQIPLHDDEVMLEPKLAARMMESLDLGPQDRVLEIGTGSGYLTALMASVAHSVHSVEILQQLSSQASRNLGMAGLQNVTLDVGDAHAGWGEDGAYDAILVSGSLPIIDESILVKLNNSGRLIGIEGQAPAMQVVRYTKNTNGIERQALFETVVPRLKNVPEPTMFAF